jgi:hypothetical protein
MGLEKGTGYRQAAAQRQELRELGTATFCGGFYLSVCLRMRTSRDMGGRVARMAKI